MGTRLVSIYRQIGGDACPGVSTRELTGNIVDPLPNTNPNGPRSFKKQIPLIVVKWSHRPLMALLEQRVGALKNISVCLLEDACAIMPG